MAYVFGPVPSRRLGFSLGIDLVPPKTCTYDCLYCQVGKTTLKTGSTGDYVAVGEVIKELERKLARSSPDSVTLAGSGEPTLFLRIDELIRRIKECTSTRIALLTNGSLFWREEVRNRVMKADVILPTLSCAFEETFKRIHRPHETITLGRVVSGLKDLRRDFKGLLLLEVVLLAGINDEERELEALRSLVKQISPDKIQLNTVVRPPADARAEALNEERLEEIRLFFGGSAEIVAERVQGDAMKRGAALGKTVCEMTRRRPLKVEDVSLSLGVSFSEAEGLLKGLVMKGYLYKKEHSGVTYYISHEEERDE